MDYRIQAMLPSHWPAVQEIYRQGIQTRNATFETDLPDWEKWDRNHRKDCRFVAIWTADGGSVLGWAALSAVSMRRVYEGVAEVSVYVAAAARGRGIGKMLLQALIRESEANGVWTLQAGIFPENVASIALHNSQGFREVGIRRRVGKLGDTWRDVMLLERRSSLVGL
jgi:phosphinothricin acetyltransferase